MNNSEIAKFLRELTSFVDTTLIPVIFALAFLVFLWGVFQYFILGGANNEQRETGRNFVMWAVIAFVVMLSFWGIINLVQRSLGFGSTTRPDLPTFNSSQKAPTNPSSPLGESKLQNGTQCDTQYPEQCRSGKCFDVSNLLGTIGTCGQ